MTNRLRILQLNTSDRGGGAEAICYNLHRSFRERGHSAQMLVGSRMTDDPDVGLISFKAGGSGWKSLWMALYDFISPFVGKVRGAGRL